jgi:dTDP-glucose 4,6-dehydratase
MTMLELAKRIIEATDSTSAIEFIERPQDDPAVRRPDTTLISSTLGWEPVVPFDQGIARTIAWFAQHPAR